MFVGSYMVTYQYCTILGGVILICLSENRILTLNQWSIPLSSQVQPCLQRIKLTFRQHYLVVAIGMQVISIHSIKIYTCVCCMREWHLPGGRREDRQTPHRTQSQHIINTLLDIHMQTTQKPADSKCADGSDGEKKLRLEEVFGHRVGLVKYIMDDNIAMQTTTGQFYSFMVISESSCMQTSQLGSTSVINTACEQL